MTYRIVTIDRNADRRQVAHRGVDADTRHDAVAVAVRRRYRLGQDATVRVCAEAYGTAYAGTYAVHLADAPCSAWYGAWVDMTRTPNDPNAHALADAEVTR